MNAADLFADNYFWLLPASGLAVRGLHWADVCIFALRLHTFGLSSSACVSSARQKVPFPNGGRFSPSEATTFSSKKTGLRSTEQFYIVWQIVPSLLPY